MVLVTHQLQGSYVAFPSRRLSWNKGLTLRRSLTTVHMVGKTERCLSLKRTFCLSVRTHVCGVKVKSVNISAFRGSAQNDESGGSASGSKSPKNSVKLSYIPKESEETITESSEVHNVPLSFASRTDETIAGSPAIHKLFKKWLTMLRTQLPSEEVNAVLEEEQPRRKIAETNIEIHNKGRDEILKEAWARFWALDTKIKIPLLSFVPLFLVVTVVHGAEVSKELIPLWILGPVIVALYIKMFQLLCTHYVFTFKQTVKVIKNLPGACKYVAQGRLQEDVRAHVWGPINTVDKKELARRKLKEFQESLTERYLDFVESIWPHYCRTIRFLKRAHLI